MLFRAISRGVTLRLVARHLCTLTPPSMCHCIPPAHSHMVYTNKHLMPAYTRQLAHSKPKCFTLYEEHSRGVCPYSHNARCYQGVFIVMQLLWCFGLLVGCCYVIVNVFWVVAMLLLGWYESFVTCGLLSECCDIFNGPQLTGNVNILRTFIHVF